MMRYDACPTSSAAGVSAKAGLWTLDWTMDWTMDWNMDSILDSFSSF